MTRKLLFNIHLVVGLAIGLILTSAGLTGSVLVWREEIDELLHPELLQVEPVGEPLSMEEVTRVASSAYPDRPAQSIHFPHARDESVEVTTAGKDPLQVYVDPYRGTILGARRPDETFTNALFYWHSKLLSGETGEWILGTTGLLLLVLVVTGVVVWWPGIRRLWDGFRVKWSANWKRVNFDVHRALGIWSTLFLTAVAVTGSSLEFHDGYMAALNWVTSSPPRPVPPRITDAGNSRLPVDRFLELSDQVIPGGKVTYVILPTQPGQVVTVRKKVPEELHPNGRNFVYLHPRTGEVLAVENALSAPLGTRAYNVLYPIHIGRWGGFLTRLLYSLLGLAPGVLFVSGCLMWWNRSGRRRLRRDRSSSRHRPRLAGSPRA